MKQSSSSCLIYYLNEEPLTLQTSSVKSGYGTNLLYGLSAVNNPKNLSQVLANMSASMFSMEKLFKNKEPDDPSESEEPLKEDIGPNINQQLADAINKRWSAKYERKDKKYTRPGNCDKLIVPRVNTEIWEKLDNKTRQQDFRTSSIQKSMANVGAILALSTETLVQLMKKKLPEVDKLVKLSTDALALLGHTSCEYCCGLVTP